MNTFDPTTLIKVVPNRRKPVETFDMRYSDKTRRFRFSTDAFTRLSLNTNGISIFRVPNGGVVLSVQSEEESQLVKRKAGTENKGREFTSSELVRLLDVKGETDFTLTHLPVEGDSPSTYYQIAEGSTEALESPQTDAAPDVTEDTAQMPVATQAAQETPELVENGQDESVPLDSSAFTEPSTNGHVENVPEAVAAPAEDPLAFITNS